MLLCAPCIKSDCMNVGELRVKSTLELFSIKFAISFGPCECCHKVAECVNT